jgi:hypothetical protein
MGQPLAEVQNRVCRPGPLPVAKKMKNLHILEEPLKNPVKNPYISAHTKVPEKSLSHLFTVPKLHGFMNAPSSTIQTSAILTL